MNQQKNNAVVGQSGGPTSAINATLAGVIRGAAKAHGEGKIGTLYGMRHGIEGLLSEEMVDLLDIFREESDLDTLALTPAAALGSCRKKLKPFREDETVYRRLFEIFEKYDIHFFFYIGGNDSMDTVAKLSAYAATVRYPLTVVGVPKTIDNDLAGTDHTPGFGSAAKYIAATMREILSDTAVYTVRAVTIVEIMGRDAGWLTAAAALPGLSGGRAPDLLYFPERPFDKNAFLSSVNAAFEKHPNVVVAISEGARYADGTYVGASAQSGATDAFGHQYLAGAGKVLEHIVREEIGCKVRSVELNLPQRCAAHLASRTDIEESLRIGAAAVSAAVRGESGVIMSFERLSDEPYRTDIRAERVDGVANAVRTLPDAFINAAGNGVTDACLRYLAPLIRGEVEPKYEDGMPVHFVLP